MNHQKVLLAAVLAFGSAGASLWAAQVLAEPGPQVGPPVTAVASEPKPEVPKRVQLAVEDLATACGYFRELYGHWPTSFADIKDRTEGIDYEAFSLDPTVTPQSDDTALIRFFDGAHWWGRKVQRMLVHLPPAAIKAAQEPGFRIRIEGPK